jgi:hypothetical protein
LVQNPYEIKKKLEEKLNINKINYDSVNKWKKIMTDEENKEFLKISGNLMSKFNYE